MIPLGTGIEDALHIGRGYRPIADAPLWGFDFEQRLQPQKPARAIAHEFRVKLARCDLRAHRGGHGPCADRKRRGVHRYEDAHGHDRAPTRARILPSSARPWSSPSTNTDGESAQ